MDLKPNLCYKRRSSTPNPVINDSDNKFLIDFIFTTYLGPDVKSEIPRCSVLQRPIAELPPYALSDLGPSHVSISLLERLYYYLLRNASSDLVLDLSMLHMYLKGNLLLPNYGFTENSKQFTSLFPLDLHQQIWYPDSFRIVKGVVLIDDPLTSYIKEEDLNRFKYLTGVKSFKLNLSECLRVRLHPRSTKEGDDNCINKGSESSPNEGCQSGKFQQEYKRKFIDDDTLPMPELPRAFPTDHDKGDHRSKKMCKSDGPTMMPFLSIPDVNDCCRDSSLNLTGTARKGLFGPSVGIVDIGTSKAAYLFRVSLPGVRKDCGIFLFFLYSVLFFRFFCCFLLSAISFFKYI